MILLTFGHSIEETLKPHRREQLFASTLYRTGSQKSVVAAAIINAPSDASAGDLMRMRPTSAAITATKTTTHVFHGSLSLSRNVQVMHSGSSIVDWRSSTGDS